VKPVNSVKPLIDQSELRTYTKFVFFKVKGSFLVVVLKTILNVMALTKLIFEDQYIRI
jgi:hypothetical protein